MSDEHRESRPGRIFISHTSDMGGEPHHAGATPSYVDSALGAVNAAGHVPIDMRWFSAESVPPPEACLGKLQSADVLLAIVGRSYGTPLPGQRRSYCEFEFDAATSLGIPRLVFLLRSAPGAHPPILDARQEAFRRRVVDALEVAYFYSPGELRTQILASLRHRLPLSPQATTENDSWGWRELEYAIQHSVEGAANLARYLGGLIIGARSEVPIEIEGSIQNVSVNFVTSFAEERVASLVRAFMSLKAYLREHPQVPLRVSVASRAGAIADMIRYLDELETRHPRSTAQMRITPTRDAGPSSVRESDEAIRELAAPLDAGDWREAIEVARRYVYAVDPEIRARSRDALVQALCKWGDIDQLGQHTELLRTLASSPEAEPTDAIRAATVFRQAHNDRDACLITDSALERWGDHPELVEFALQLALHTGDHALARRARRRRDGRR